MAPTCFDGLACWRNGRQGLKDVTTEIIRPAGGMQLPRGKAPTTPLLAFEEMFTQAPLPNAGYAALAFRLVKADDMMLKTSLASLLATHPIFAGRMNGKTVSLTNDGVPFTVALTREATAPNPIKEADLLKFSDFRRPGLVARGWEPLMTVKLTKYRDGSAVLSVTRTHGLADGTTIWALMNDWARIARGESEPKAVRNVEDLARQIPNEDVFKGLCKEILNIDPDENRRQAMMTKLMFRGMAPFKNTEFLWGLCNKLHRPRVTFTDGEMARVKAAGTPLAGWEGDSWVSTQEAMAAYFMWTAAQTLLPSDTKGTAMLVLLLDVRKALGVHPGSISGSGVAFAKSTFEGIHKKSFREFTKEVHDKCQAASTPDRVKKGWQLSAAASEVGIPYVTFGAMMGDLMKHDVALMLNNQMKRTMPDFGPAGSGGAAQTVVTNAGPTLFFPLEGGGAQVYLDATFMAKANTPEKLHRFLTALQDISRVDSDKIETGDMENKPLLQGAFPAGRAAKLGA
eukprot:CAMPEP_0206474866 /NCGR_PEP_ID=MMETSP0324_2-20121206/33739_1 /ASSEMBLY_ACC=CAM_ASM_000836 /TAXON_ID=2866 /ORGANISM="Crypthecodinium cohnii, Strain Seligo" /LENGTH=511 /DNA_ID=CAMNT_0053950115 /DNA_START=87 /DNA_END=1622 /DNA_ORIENTATION=-